MKRFLFAFGMGLGMGLTVASFRLVKRAAAGLPTAGPGAAPASDETLTGRFTAAIQEGAAAMRAAEADLRDKISVRSAH